MKSAMLDTPFTMVLVALATLFAAGCSTTPPGAWGEAVSYAGPRNEAGATRAQGAGDAVGIWTAYREYWFASGESEMLPADVAKAGDVARYIKENPGQQVGIDGLSDPDNMQLSNVRITTVRNALIVAGVPAERIQVGVYGRVPVQNNRLVEVLVGSR
jgi:outer membrane protein OmpA-like peptidoglycan-associated protein